MKTGTKTLTGLQQTLFDALQTRRGEWLSRDEIAVLIGRKTGKLLPYDVQLLEHLERDGVIEIKKELINVAREVWRYRAV